MQIESAINLDMLSHLSLMRLRLIELRFKDALKRTAQAADLAGIRALLVHAKDADVKLWYERFNFEPSQIDPLSLFLLLKDLKKILESNTN